MARKKAGMVSYEDTTGTETEARSPGETIEITEAEEGAALPPVNQLLSDDEKQALAEYVANEISNEVGSDSRSKYLDKVEKWRRQRLARPEQEIKDKPFPKSTNLAPPLTMSKVNTIYGKVLAGYSLKRPFWDAATNNPSLKREAAAFGRLLNAYANDPFSLNLRPVLRRAFYESISLGPQFYEIAWANDKTSITNTDGTITEAVLRSGPEVRLYSIEDFVINQTWTDFQKAPLVAMRFDISWGEILNLRDLERYNPDAVEAIRPMKKTTVTDAQAAAQELAGLNEQPADSEDITATFELYRFYAKWIVKDKVIDFIGVIHLESKQILYLEPNPLGWRLLGKIGYFLVPDSVYDIGVCHQCEYLQEEAEMLHNLGGDAMKWTMLGMIKAKKDSGISQNEPIYPGKLWLLDNLDDVEEMKFEFDLNPALAKENIVMRYADMATGANQAMSGQADTTLKSGGGALAQQVLKESSSTILDAEFETLDEYVAEMGKLLGLLLMKNSQFIPLESLVPPEDVEILRGFFDQYSTADIVSQFRFSVKTTDIQRSESTKKETLALFSQLYTGYVSEVFGLMGQRMQLEMAASAAPQGTALGAAQSAAVPAPQGTASSPRLSQMVSFLDKAISGKTDLMRQIADYMHVGIDLDKYFIPEETTNDGSGQESSPGAPSPMGTEPQVGGGFGNRLPPDSANGLGVDPAGAPNQRTQGL